MDFIKELDAGRLVNNASGWSDRNVGDVLDLHHYPEPILPKPEESRAVVLGEFGGLGYPVEGHTWVERNWGYQTMSSLEDLLARYEEFYTSVWKFKDQGLSAAADS